MALMLWILLVTLAMAGGGLAAMTTVPGRRASGLAAATAGVAGLLVLLGLDLPAAIWLGVGGAAALLAVPAGHQSDQGPAVPGPHPRRGPLLGAGLAVGLLFAMLYRVVLQVDWHAEPAGPVTGQTSVTGGVLLTTDVALLAAVVVLLTLALAVVGRPRVKTSERGSGS